METELKSSSYFFWLCDMIDCKSHEQYKETLLQLDNVAFYSLIPNDDNRGLDGVQLRVVYEDESGIFLSEDYLHDPCTLLEMLIALAERMAYIIFDPAKNDEPNNVSCFWQLVKNLKLKPQAMNNYVLIETFLERNYAPSGDGGLFPLLSTREDQRDIEIWYQMMAYIEEGDLL